MLQKHNSPPPNMIATLSTEETSALLSKVWSGSDCTTNLRSLALQIYLDFEEIRWRALQSIDGNPYGVCLSQEDGVRLIMTPHHPQYNRAYVLHENLDLSSLQKCMDFYNSAREDFEVLYPPVPTEHPLCQALIRKGLIPWGYFSYLYSYLEQTPERAETESIQVRCPEAQEIEEFIDSLLEGFEVERYYWKFLRALLQQRYRNTSFHLAVAVMQDQVIATGTMVKAGEVALLAEMATRPNFRGMGGRLALVHYWRQLASKLGCRMIIGCAEFGSPLYRILQSAGLHESSSDLIWRYRNEHAKSADTPRALRLMMMSGKRTARG